MTKLLVSVRNAWEAQEAQAGGAQVIDVKEPRLGSLGAASPETWSAVRSVVIQTDGSSSHAVKSPCLSAALGELLESPTAMTSHLEGYAYAKVGLAGCGATTDWFHRWQKWIAELPAATAPVAVVYADYRSANAPVPWRILEAARQSSVSTLLVDTFDKAGGDVMSRMSGCELEAIVSEAHAMGLQVALAGSITWATLEDALRFQPDWIAVRGAVCRGGRESTLDRELVERFVRCLSTPRATNPATQAEQMIDSMLHQE